MDKYNLNELETIYIGGGTPSLYPDFINEINKFINSSISLNVLKEYTLECNPNDISDNLVEIIKKTKINRFSIGIQSFSERILENCNREQKINDILKSIEILENNNFNISIDLINGLPGLNYKDEIEKLAYCLNKYNNINHISFYDLTIDKECKFYYDTILKLPDQNILDIYEKEFVKLISSFGFARYEVSNYCKNNYKSIHNLNYWKYNNYLGVGPSSHSTIHDIRIENANNLKKYCYESNYKIEYRLSKIDQIKEFLLLGFRLMEGINLKIFKNRFKINFNKIFNLTINKYKEMFVINQNNILLKKSGILILNKILVDLFIELEKNVKKIND